MILHATINVSFAAVELIIVVLFCCFKTTVQYIMLGLILSVILCGFSFTTDAEPTYNYLILHSVFTCDVYDMLDEIG